MDVALGEALADVRRVLPGWIVGLVIGPEVTRCTLTPPYMAAAVEWEASRNAREGVSGCPAEAVSMAMASVTRARSSFCLTAG